MAGQLGTTGGLQAGIATERPAFGLTAQARRHSPCLASFADPSSPPFTSGGHPARMSLLSGVHSPRNASYRSASQPTNALPNESKGQRQQSSIRSRAPGHSLVTSLCVALSRGAVVSAFFCAPPWRWRNTWHTSLAPPPVTAPHPKRQLCNHAPLAMLSRLHPNLSQPAVSNACLAAAGATAFFAFSKHGVPQPLCLSPDALGSSSEIKCLELSCHT
jgi:hypothetical protein